MPLQGRLYDMESEQLVDALQALSALHALPSASQLQQMAEDIGRRWGTAAEV